MLRKIDGANLYKNSADIAFNWTVSSRISVIAGAGRRPGCGAFQSTSIGLTGFYEIIDDQPTWIVGFGLKRISPGNDPSLTIYDSTNGEQISLKADGTTGQLKVYSGATLLWDSGGDARYRVVVGVWRYIEFKATIDGATGSWALRVDGLASTEVGQTNVNTAAAGGTTADKIGWGCGSIYYQVTDIYIADGTGGVDNDFLGDIRIDPIFPNANGTNDQWLKSTGVDAYALVDESTPNDDTDYLYSNTLNDLTTINMEDMPYIPTIIYGLQIGIHGKKTDSGPRGITPAIRTNANDYLSSVELPLQTNYSILPTALFTVNPNTLARFTQSEIDAIEIGAKLTS